MNSVWKKRIFFLLPVLVLLAGALLFLRGQKPEPIYFRTAAFGRLTERLEGDPFTVYRWDGGETYTPVFTAEEAEEVWAEASAIVGKTLYYTVTTEDHGSVVYRVDLQTGEKTCLAELESRIWFLMPCGENLFLTVFDEAQRQNRLGVLREGAFLDCASAAVFYAPLSCDGRGCWYVDYESGTHFASLCYLPADTLTHEKVYENIPHPIELQAAPEGVYLSCQLGEDFDAGTFSLLFYPRDGSGRVKLLTELLPDGRKVTGEKREDLMPNFALWGERLFYLTYIGWSKGDGEDVGYYLHCLDRKTGRVTDYGKFRGDTGVGSVSFSYLLTCGKRGFLLNESNWWATEPEVANAWSCYTWSGKRTELRPAE